MTTPLVVMIIALMVRGLIITAIVSQAKNVHVENAIMEDLKIVHVKNV